MEKGKQRCTTCLNVLDKSKFYARNLDCQDCINKRHAKERAKDNYSSSLYNKIIDPADNAMFNAVVRMPFVAR